MSNIPPSIPFLEITTIALLLTTLWKNEDSTSFLRLTEATIKYCLPLAKGKGHRGGRKLTTDVHKLLHSRKLTFPIRFPSTAKAFILEK